ncbi:ATP-dependent Lon protease [bacterium BRH_c32]|nr:MAG: ATP-dependent Lon protease [bacterium BRH_c32]
MNILDKKINTHYAGKVVRKDLTKLLKSNAIVPTYVLEYLLGQYCATDDENTINSGIETIKGILSKHYVHREQAELVKSTIKEKGHHKIIDKITATLNDKKGTYEVVFSNLGLKKVEIHSLFIQEHPKLLVGGVWCLVDMEYVSNSEDPNSSPWVIANVKPIQLSSFDYEEYIESRKSFSLDEWIDILIQSIGLKPEYLSKRKKLLHLVRLISFCERNYNLIELGPKGTGKSHIFSEFSPHGILISGGEVSVPKLFVNNSNGRIGLVGYWDVVAFDEFAGQDKKVDKNLVDIMKNYLANKTFSRGIEQLGAEASMVFIGNTKHSLPYMLKHENLFSELPDKYYDPAYLDRLHFYLPGWEIDTLRSELFTDGYGFVVDYLAEVLKYLRTFDYSHNFTQYFELDSSIATRDKDAILKSYSGLMKILFPDGSCSKEESKELLEFVIEGRKRVKNQLLKIDETFMSVSFSFVDKDSNSTYSVKTLEENQYPLYASPNSNQDPQAEQPELALDSIPQPISVQKKYLEEKHLILEENKKGISYQLLFADYLKDAKNITIHDPYIRHFYQTKNLMEFCQMLLRLKPSGEEISVHLFTKYDDGHEVETSDRLDKIVDTLNSSGINLSYEFDQTDSFHARSITPDNGWKIILDRGLDIFQPYNYNDILSLPANMQEERFCKKFEVTYIYQKNSQVN